MQSGNKYEKIKIASSIAKHVIQSCSTDEGLIAGVHHFVDLWARDSLFATFGLYSKKELSVAKTTVEAFLRYQRSDGLIPYRILRSNASLSKYFGNPSYRSQPQANFRSHQSGGLVLDGGLMTVIAFAEYVRRSGDKQFLQTRITQLTRAMQWYEKRFSNKLTTEWFQCEWADAVLKVGKTFYTNILYWKALGDMGDLARILENKSSAKLFTYKQKVIGDAMHQEFWNGKFFADWIDYRRQDYFAVHPNMLAIMWGLATKHQADFILDMTKRYCFVPTKRKNAQSAFIETNYPTYPVWRIPLGNYFVGLSDYHNRGCLWLQPGILFAIALHETGKSAEAENVLGAIAEKIAEYDGVYEVYEKSGKPVNRLFYKAEHPFAWSAGLFLWACHLIFGK